MTKLLTQTSKDKLTSQVVNSYIGVTVAGISRKAFLKQADYQFSRDFGAAHATVVLTNPGGMFSPGVATEIKKGDAVVITEGFIHTEDNTVETYGGFAGFVKKRKGSKRGDNTIALTCADNLNKLAGTDIDYKKSGTKNIIATEQLTPHFLHLHSGSGTYAEDYIEDTSKAWKENALQGMWLFDDDDRAWPIKYNSATRAHCDGIASGVGDSKSYAIGEGIAQVFDAEFDNWARRPLPGITVRNNSDRARDANTFMAQDEIPTEWSGFTVKYENGQVVMNLPIDAVNYRVEANYSYYETGVHVEDILEEIITEPDDYGDEIFTVANHLTSKFSDQSRDNYDAMTPNYSPDTDPDLVTGLATDVDSTTTQIVLRDGTGYRSPIPGETDYLQVGKEIIGYEGRVSNVASGLTRGALGTVEQEHSRNDKTYQLYPAGQLWFTKFSNVTNTLVATDFTITGGTFDSFNARYGRVALKSSIAINADVRCNTDYSFKTLQATGVQINEIELGERDFKNRIAAIKRVKELVAPNYVLRTEGDEKIWGSYLNQKYEEDYRLRLTESLDYEDEEDVYTHVKLYGQNNNPTNLMAENPVKVVQSKYWEGEDGSGHPSLFVASGGDWGDDEVQGYQLMDGVGNFHNIYSNHDTNHLIVSGQPYDGDWKVSRFYIGETWDHGLVFKGETADYYKFDPGLGTMGRIITNYPDSPKIKINGVVIDGPKPVAVGPVPVKKITDTQQIIETLTNLQGQQETQAAASAYYYFIELPHTDIVSDIYKISDGAIDTENDIFIYLVGQAGGGVHASIQFFSNADNIVPYVAGNWGDVSQLMPLFTIPVNDPNVDYRKGVWAVKGIPSYEKIEKALFESVDPDSTTIKILVQKYYQNLADKVEVIERHDTGTCTTLKIIASPLKYRMTDTSKTWVEGEHNNKIVIDSTGKEFKIYRTMAPNILEVKHDVPVAGTYHIYPHSVTSQEVVNSPNIGVYEHLYDGSQWVDADVLLRSSVPDFADPGYGANKDLALGNVFASIMGSVERGLNVLPEIQFYMNETGHTIYRAMRFGNKMLSDPNEVDYPVIQIDGRELVAYSGINKIDEWEEMHDLTDTFNGPNIGHNGDYTFIIGQSAWTTYMRGELMIRVVNEVWELTGCTRGAHGSTPQQHNTSHHDGKFCALMDGPNIIQKRFFYRNFGPGAPITDIENVGSAIYYVWHKDDGDPDFYVDHNDSTFMIKKSFFADVVYGAPHDVVQADFKYAQYLVPLTNWQLMFDGRYNTKAQAMFMVAPLAGTEIFTIDFGASVQMDAIDILGGYFSLQGANTSVGQVQVTNNYTLRYSLDNETWLLPSEKAENFSLASGSTFSLERDDLGPGFTTRYLKLELESAQKHDYDGGKWFISIADFRCWADTVLVGDVKLIERQDNGLSGTGAANSMTDATKSWSVNQWVGYWLVDLYGNEFYITTNSASALTVSGTPNTGEYWIFEAKETSSTVYDRDDLLTQLGDRLHKVPSINEKVNTQATIDRMAKESLKEYIKNHGRCSATVVFHPAIKMGQTVLVVDDLNNINKRYFVESVAKQGYKKSLTMGHYPS